LFALGTYYVLNNSKKKTSSYINVIAIIIIFIMHKHETHDFKLIYPLNTIYIYYRSETYRRAI